jgi:MoxR-like ATPase
VAAVHVSPTVGHMKKDYFEEAGATLEVVTGEIGKVIVGQHLLVDRLLTALLAEGHLLVEGVPGLAKTRTVKTAATVVGGSWQRVQFTPDLVPSDLLGTRVYQPQSGEFTTELGPLMANFVLADEVNRAPAKVQSALLEAMEERQITIGRTTYPLPRPFIVLATQNPVEQEGTYPLPEAQMDRFMMRVTIGHPSAVEELEIVRRSLAADVSVAQQLTVEELQDLQALAKQVHVGKEVAGYAVALVEATRTDRGSSSKAAVELGASPRASIALVRAAQSQALLAGRRTARVSDVKAVANEVIAHRLVLSFAALSDGVSAADVVADIVERTQTPSGADV